MYIGNGNWLTFSTCSVTENANAPDDSRIWAKEAWCENRTFRRDACQVSLKISLTKSTRMNSSMIVERVHYLLPRPIITIAFLLNPNVQANVSEKNPRIIYCASTFSLIYVLFHFLCYTLYYSDYFLIYLLLFISLVLLSFCFYR